MFLRRRNCLSICQRFRQLSTALNDLGDGGSNGDGRCGSQMIAAGLVVSKSRLEKRACVRIVKSAHQTPLPPIAIRRPQVLSPASETGTRDRPKARMPERYPRAMPVAEMLAVAADTLAES